MFFRCALQREAGKPRARDTVKILYVITVHRISIAFPSAETPPFPGQYLLSLQATFSEVLLAQLGDRVRVRASYLHQFL